MSPDSSNPPADNGASAADLKLVDESVDFADHAATSESHETAQSQYSSDDDSGARSLPIWMFVVGLIMAVVVIGWQAQLASELEAEVAGLERQLERTHSLLEAHRSHLGEIQGGVHDLSERLDGLRALVDAGPPGEGASEPALLPGPAPAAP